MLSGGGHAQHVSSFRDKKGSSRETVAPWRVIDPLPAFSTVTVARPIPLDAPVTRIDRSEKSKIVFISRSRRL